MMDIKYEDEYLFVVNKPRGMVTHHGVGVSAGTLYDEILLANPVSADLERGGIVHRLDKNTAGLLVVAKDVKTQELLKDLIKAHKIRRTYLGLVEGVLDGSGTIDKNLTRSSKNRTLYTVCARGTGREAVTHYTAVENFKLFTLVRFVLETGRTHQIRVHAKSIGHPIVGDNEYNPRGKMSRGIGQMLESVEIEFAHPVTCAEVHIKIPTTAVFGEQVRKCGVTVAC
jgi:23S rRNA pseudouridine1911/1915/1917 synthase